jgi:anti-anti-sigma regulatory factor
MYERSEDPNPKAVLINAIGDLDLVLSSDISTALRNTTEPYAVVDLGSVRTVAADGLAALDQTIVELRTRGRSIDVIEPRRRRNAKRQRSALDPSRIIILAHSAR